MPLRVTALTDTDIADAFASYSQEQHHYLRPLRTLISCGFVLLLTVVPIGALAWFCLDAGWMPATPDFSRFRRGMVYALIAWAFFVLFMKLPVWIRISILAWSSSGLIRLVARRILHAFDHKPDLTIGPAGIGGLDKTGFQRIPWPDVKTVTSYGPSVEVVGQEHGPRRFYGTLPPRRVKILYSQFVFKIQKKDVLAAIRYFCPDVKITEIEVKYWRW